MADGRIDASGRVRTQENRLVALMAEVGAALAPANARQGDRVALRTDGLRLHAGDDLAGEVPAESGLPQLARRVRQAIM